MKGKRKRRKQSFVHLKAQINPSESKNDLHIHCKFKKCPIFDVQQLRPQPMKQRFSKETGNRQAYCCMCMLSTAT